MGKIMAVNAGSSSIKFQLLEMPSEEVVVSGVMERIGLESGIFTLKYNGKKEETFPVLPNHKVGVELILYSLIEKGILKSLDEIEGVGHRVVQGGEFFKDSALITPEVLNKVIALSDLAPLHNPANATGIKSFQGALPNVKQVVVFDTVFHQSMPEENFLYALPYEWYTKYGIRKYGAHGTSHQYVSQRTAEILNKSLEDTKIIVCHLGNGASICAVDGGKSVDTSMGLTPLEGIPMGTRSGIIDPTIVAYICEKENLTPADVINILNKKSGYLGVSGISNDARDVTNAMEQGNHRAAITFDVQAKRIVDYIASYYVLMGGCDAISFTAGIGENVIHLRANIVNRLKALGIKLDVEANNVRGIEKEITTSDSTIKVFIVPTNEEVMIARDTVRIAKL